MDGAYRVRSACESDQMGLRSLYREVTSAPGALARRPEEVTDGFVRRLIRQTNRSGLCLIVEDPAQDRLVGAIHATYGDVEALRHVMGHLTILIHPEFQKQGLGKMLFSEFLKVVERDLPFVQRVELRARASNSRALGLYQSLGFIEEGRFHGRIRTLRALMRTAFLWPG